MTKSFNFSLKKQGVVGRVAHAKSSDPATLPQKKKNWNVHSAKLSFWQQNYLTRLAFESTAKYFVP